MNRAPPCYSVCEFGLYIHPTCKLDFQGKVGLWQHIEWLRRLLEKGYIGHFADILDPFGGPSNSRMFLVSQLVCGENRGVLPES